MDQDQSQFRYLQWLNFVTDSYSDLGGLRLMPIALFSLFMASFVSGTFALPVDWMISLGGLGLEFTVVGYWWIALWYRKNFGMTDQAWPSSNLELGRWLLVWAAVSLMVLSALDDLSVFMEVTGYLAGMAAAGWILFYWKRKGEMWPQSYALLVLFSIGAIMYQAPLPQEHGLFGLLLAFLGITLLVVSVIDHDRLTKTMKPLGEDEDE